MNPSRCLTRALLTTLMLVGTPALAKDKQLVFGTFSDPDSRICQEIMRVAYLKLGYQMTTTNLPGERALVMANDGIVDGDNCRIEGIEQRYSNLIAIPVQINQLDAMAFTKGLDIDVKGWDSLYPYRVSTLLGLKFAERGLARQPADKLQLVATTEQSFLKLDAGRVDIVVAGRLSGLWQIQVLKLKGITMQAPALEQFKLYHYVHIKHADLVPLLTKVLQEMQSRGELASLRRDLEAHYLGGK